MSKAKITYQRLIAFAAGELSPQERAEIEQSLASDPEAADTVARYRAAGATMQADESVDPPANVIAKAKAIFTPPRLERTPSWWRRLEQVIATMTFDSRAQPALAGYRGSGSGFQLAFESSKGEVDLQVEPLGPPSPDPNSVRWQLLGQVNAPQTEPIAAVALVAANADEPTADTEADEHGMFTIEIQPGKYDLMVQIGDTVVVLKDLKIA